MNAIIIENEYDIEPELKGFIKDNPSLFESVDEQIGCSHRELKEIGKYIAKADAVIVQSTWMYINQAKEFVEAFANKKFGKIYHFYIARIVLKLNDWLKEEQCDTEFINNLIKLVTEQEVYDIKEDWDSDLEIVDRFNLWNREMIRKPFIYLKVKYNKEQNLFYYENEKYN